MKIPIKSFCLYWRCYGGFSSLLSSFYFWIALDITLVIVWFNHDKEELWQWHTDVIDILPSILGFALGGYAILAGFGNEKFLSVMRGKETKKDISPYMVVNASFFHFIFIEFISLIYAIFFKIFNCNNLYLYYLGIFLFFYALFTIVSTAFSVLNLADWFDTMQPPDNEN